MWKEEQTHTLIVCQAALLTNLSVLFTSNAESCLRGELEVQQSGLLQSSDDNSAQVLTSNLLL